MRPGAKVALHRRTDLSVGGIKGRLRGEQKSAYDMRPEGRHLGEPPTERRILTLSPSSKMCSISEALLPEFASNVFLVNGSNVSKSVGNPSNIRFSSHSLKTVVPGIESTLSWGIKSCEIPSLLDRKKDCP